MLTLRERLNRFPPFLCLALARVSKAGGVCDRRKKEALRHWEAEEAREREAMIASGQSSGLTTMVHYRRLSTLEVATRGRLNYKAVERMAHRIDWGEVQVDNMLSFLEGCGIDLLDFEAAEKLLVAVASSERPFGHLPVRARDLFLERFGEWQERAGTSRAPLPR